MKKGNSLSKQAMRARTWTKPHQTAQEKEDYLTQFMHEQAFKAAKQKNDMFVTIYDAEENVLCTGSAEEIIEKYTGTEYEYGMTMMKIGGRLCHASVHFLRELRKAYLESKQ